MGSMTAEIPDQLAPMDADEARGAVDRVRLGLGMAADSALALWLRRGWEPLGYESWVELCRAEFGGSLWSNVEERRELTVSFRARGMSTRAIGAVLGIDQRTAAADNRSGAGDPAPEPERVTGTDGKSYPTGTGWPEAPVEPEPAPGLPPGDAEHRLLERAFRVAGEAARVLAGQDPAALIAAAEPNRRTLDRWRGQFDRLRESAQRYEEAC
jgi:hypothetical protein